MFKGAFAAGFSQGFGETVSKGIEERRRQREKYLDMTLDNARAAAPGLAASEADVANMANMYEQMNADFGITKEEFLGIAENYDINAVYNNVYTAKTVMEKNGINGMIDKGMILGGLKVADQYQFGGSVEDGLRMIFQGTTANIDPKNKSESHRMGAFGKAVAEGLALNPRRSAEEMAAGMQVAGVPVERLLAFQAAGGVKQTPFGQIEATGPFAAIDVDYTDTQFKTTTNTFASVFSRKFAGTDDPMDLSAALQGNANLLSAFGENATAEAVYDQVFSAGNTMARLEKQLIGKGLNLGMGSSNTRYDALAGVASRLETVEEMQRLVKLIESGDDVAGRILQAYEKDQMITDKEMDFILGSPADDVPDADPIVVSQDPSLPEGLGGGNTQTAPVETITRQETPKEETGSGRTTAKDLIDRNKKVEDAVEAGPLGRNTDADMSVGFDEQRTPTVSMVIEREVREALDVGEVPVSDDEGETETQEQPFITYEAWEEMSKEGRKRLGLDLSKFRIQNMTRGGRIPIPQEVDTSVFFQPELAQPDEPKGATRQEGFQLFKMQDDNRLRTNDREVGYNQRQLKQGIMDDGRGLMSQKAEKPPVTMETTSIEEPKVPVELVDLADMMKRVHGTGKVFADYEKLLQKENPSYTEINKLLRATKKLRKSETRDKLMQELYLLAEEVRG